MILGLKLAPKIFIIIYCVKLGKPYVLPISVGTPQGATMAQRVKDAAKSKSQIVMTWIRTQ